MSELRVDNIVDMGGSGAPQLRKGANVTGISTITQAVVGNVTINAGGINATGVVTSSSNKFVGDFASGNITAGVMTATSSVVASNITINSGGVNASGIVSATSYAGSGANLTGIGLSIASLAVNPPISGMDASLTTGIGITFNQRVFAGVGTVTLSLVSVGSTVAEVLGIGTAVTKTYTVTVSNPGSGNKYYLDGNLSYNPTLYPGGIYTFDQSAGTNGTHPLRFATAADAAGSTEYTTGVETNGTPGSSGAYTRITVAADAPDTLYYYCTNHSGMGSNVSIGANFTFNNDADPPNVTATLKNNLNGDSVIAISYPSGVFVKNDGSSFVGTAYTFDTTSQTFGELYMWGDNTYGNLGQNNTTKYSSPVQIPGTTWKSGARGNLHTVATKANGTLWAWGENEYGQLSQNDRINKSSPVQVGSDTTWSKANVSSWSAYAIKTDGTLWAWGGNDTGELGLNDTNKRSSPVQVGSDTSWSATGPIGINNYSSVWGLKTDGTLWAWGRNNNGQLGHNNITSYSSPKQIPGTWNDVAGGGNFVLGSKTDGTFWGWGLDTYGSLAQNSNTPDTNGISSPVQIPGTTWNKVMSNGYSSAATKTDGTLWAWGINHNGQLAQNNRTNYSSPVQIPGTTWVDPLNFGATKTDGTLWAWGDNGNGQIGVNDTNKRSSPVQIPGTTWNVDDMRKFVTQQGPYGGMYKKIP